MRAMIRARRFIRGAQDTQRPLGGGRKTVRRRVADLGTRKRMLRFHVRRVTLITRAPHGARWAFFLLLLSIPDSRSPRRPEARAAASAESPMPPSPSRLRAAA